MDWASVLGSVSGGVLGFLGAIGHGIFTVWQKKSEHKMKLEELEVLSRIDLQKADINLRQTQEEKAGEAFNESIRAQAALQGEGKTTKNILALFRPGLTALLLLASIVLSFFASGETQQFQVMSIHNMAFVALGYWFGVRQMEKVQVQAAFPRR